MTSPDDSCCRDFTQAARTSRRGFLTGLAAAGGTLTATAAFGTAFRETAFGATRGNNVLIVLSMRGGVDGMSVVVPHGDPGYYRARPTIAVPAASLIASDAMFGLHPSMKPLLPMWKNGRLAAVHAAGLPAPNRSHFAAMEAIEDADPGSKVRRGWVNRLIGMDTDASPVEAVQMGGGVVPTSLYGPAPVMSARRLDAISIAGAHPVYDDRGDRRRRVRQLHTVWDAAHGPLGRGGRAALDTAAKVAPVAATEYKPKNKAVYPTDDLGIALQDTARLIRADLGAQVIAIDFGSWDHHVGLGSITSGPMTSMVGRFATALAAFYQDLGALGDRVTTVTISEFGRRLAQNGSYGLDHGWGNMMLLAGAGVHGGRYYSQWPGLGLDEQVDGDLAVTTDYRSVLTEVVRDRFPHISTAKLFPGFQPQQIRVMR